VLVTDGPSKAEQIPPGLFVRFALLSEWRVHHVESPFGTFPGFEAFGVTYGRLGLPPERCVEAGGYLGEPLDAWIDESRKLYRVVKFLWLTKQLRPHGGLSAIGPSAPLWWFVLTGEWSAPLVEGATRRRRPTHEPDTREGQEALTRQVTENKRIEADREAQAAAHLSRAVAKLREALNAGLRDAVAVVQLSGDTLPLTYSRTHTLRATLWLQAAAAAAHATRIGWCEADGCEKPIVYTGSYKRDGKRADARYCSTTCQNRMKKRAQRARQVSASQGGTHE
jgi:hypothetical protein